MTDEVKKIKEERTQIFHDVYDNKVPKRVPITFGLGLNVIAEYAGISGRDALWHADVLAKAAEDLGKMIPTDTNIMSMAILSPAKYQTLGSNNMKMNSAGCMQHPNHVGMLPEDYDAFIEDPYACMLDRVLPRNFNEFAKPGRQLLVAQQAQSLTAKVLGENLKVMAELSDKFGYYSAAPGTGTGVYAPVDIITDTLRSLSGMSIDIRRMRDKVLEAVHAVEPLNYKIGLPQRIDNYGSAFFPLHLATFIKEKDFLPIFWEPWLRQITGYASMGYHSSAFCEHNWDRYLDYLLQVPVDTRLQFEQGDPKTIKEKLGRHCILTGLFPLSTLRTCTVEQCVERTKEFLEIMMPHGKFVFGFNENALTFGDINLDNLCAVLETVRDYGVYDNAGEVAGEEFHKEDYAPSTIPEFTSKYYKTWEQYLEENPYTPECAKQLVMQSEDEIVRFVYGLCQ